MRAIQCCGTVVFFAIAVESVVESNFRPPSPDFLIKIALIKIGIQVYILVCMTMADSEYSRHHKGDKMNPQSS